MFNQLLFEANLVNEELIALELEYNDTVLNDQENSNDINNYQSDHKSRSKRSFLSKAFKWLFGGNDESAKIKQLKNNIKILFDNQKLHSVQMQEAMNFNNLTRVEMCNNRKMIREVAIDLE